MFQPRNEDARQKLEESVRGLKSSVLFAVFMGWLKDELKSRDTENRIPGFENKTSEAGALAYITEHVAAWQAPEPDDEDKIEGAESESAGNIM